MPQTPGTHCHRWGPSKIPTKIKGPISSSSIREAWRSSLNSRTWALAEFLWRKKENLALTEEIQLRRNWHTWMVAPLAYQKGPLTPYSHATFELCKIVAAHVHCTVPQSDTCLTSQNFFARSILKIFWLETILGLGFGGFELNLRNNDTGNESSLDVSACSVEPLGIVSGMDVLLLQPHLFFG